MLTGQSVAKILADRGFTHIVWIPDSHLGTWETGILAEPRLKLVRAAREGEVIAIAAGLLIGGAKPMAIMQCTGLFEAGDALRNVAHDLKLPLRLIVGVRSGIAFQKGPTIDTCPRYMEPFVKAWDLPYVTLASQEPGQFAQAAAELEAQATASVLLIPE